MLIAVSLLLAGLVLVAIAVWRTDGVHRSMAFELGGALMVIGLLGVFGIATVQAVDELVALASGTARS